MQSKDKEGQDPVNAENEARSQAKERGWLTEQVRTGPKEWPSNSHEFDSMYLDTYGGKTGKRVDRLGTPVTPSTTLIVYSATTEDRARAYLQDGIDPGQKPRSKERKSFERGKLIGSGSGRALSKGLYVAHRPEGTGIYAHNKTTESGESVARAVIAIRVKAQDIHTPPEQMLKGVTDGIEALCVDDAVIERYIEPSQIKLIGLGSSVTTEDARHVLVEHASPVEPPPRNIPREFEGIMNKPVEELSRREIMKLLTEAVPRGVIKPFSAEWWMYANKVDENKRAEIVRVARDVERNNA